MGRKYKPRKRGFFIAYLRSVSELLDSGLFGIDRDSTLLEKSLINQAVNQTNRVLLIRILSRLEGCSNTDLLNECSSMDTDNLKRELERMQKFPIVS